MVTYRKALPGEREAYVAFADMVFGASGDSTRFETDVPKVYAPGVDSADMHYLAVDDARGIVGLAAVLPGEICAGGVALKTGYIGTVCVHPQARGEGHMKRLMAMALDDMRANGTDLALLNGQRQRYEHFGFAFGGEMLRFTLSEGCVRHALRGVPNEDVCIEPMRPGSPEVPLALALHDARPVRFARDADSFVDVCRTYAKTPWALSRGGEFLGYLVSGREKSAIAEIAAASADALKAMLKAWFVQNGLKRLEVSVPPADAATARRMASLADGQAMGACINVRAFNHRRVLQAMLAAKASYRRLADGRMDFDVEGDRFSVAVADGRVEVSGGGTGAIRLTELEASRLYIAPFDYEGRPECPDGWFPLPICATSPDAF